MNDPTNSEPTVSYVDPDIDAECSELARAIAPIVLDELRAGVPHEDTPHGRALVASVYRAIDELEGQGARSARIAGQLIMALARYELAVESWAPAETDEFPATRVGACHDCGRLGRLQCLTDQEQDHHPHLVCEQGCSPRYRIEWCEWEHGGDAEHQEWKPSDVGRADESEARACVRRMDTEFAPRWRHRYVEVKP